jgi:hypothetical protein
VKWRWCNTIVSGLVLFVALATSSSARAQYAYLGNSGQPSVRQFGLGYGAAAAYGAWPHDYRYGSIGAAGYGGLKSFGVFTVPGYGRSIGQRPLTTTSYQSISNVVTLVPGWSGAGHRMHRRH